MVQRVVRGARTISDARSSPRSECPKVVPAVNAARDAAAHNGTAFPIDHSAACNDISSYCRAAASSFSS